MSTNDTSHCSAILIVMLTNSFSNPINMKLLKHEKYLPYIIQTFFCDYVFCILIFKSFFMKNLQNCEGFS